MATVCLQKFTCAMALKNDAFHLMIPPQFQGPTLSGLTSFIMYRSIICKLSSRGPTVDGQNPAPPRMIIIPSFIGF